MRVFLIVLVLLALFATVWHAAFQGTDLAHMKGAPQIERQIHRAAIKIVAGMGGDPVEVRTTGRRVVLVGPVDSAGKRDTLVDRIGKLPLVAGVTDQMKVLDRADPFTIAITRSADGALVMTGFVPNRRAEDRLLAEAREFAARAGVEARLKLAAGAPDGNWTGMVSAGLRALAELQTGTLSIEGDTADLTGETASPAADEAARAAVASAPMGRWTVSLSAARPADGYTFTADKPVEGPVSVTGYAPDAETAEQLDAAVRDRTGRATRGQLRIAEGMPGPDWPDLIARGLDVLARLEQGRLAIRDRRVAIEGTVDTDPDLAALSPLMDEDWRVAITVRNPTPPGRLSLELKLDGSVKVSGLLPEGMEPAAVAAALPEADISGIEPELRGKPADWTGLLDALSIVLPRFVELDVTAAGETLTAKGLLQRGFSADGVHAALRSALGSNWSLTLSAVERRPLAEVTLTRQFGATTLSGVLPVGLSTSAVLSMLGDNEGDMGLTGGGEGDPDAWHRTLEAISVLVPAFSSLNATISERHVALTGTLRPGYEADRVRQRVAADVAQGWDVELSAAETAASEGDRRTNLDTGEPETFRNGHWLPDVAFPVSVGSCTDEVDAVMGESAFSFEPGSPELDPADAGLLNRLAAVAIRCLNSSSLRMEVSAHTSSVGNDAENRALTASRAEAIVAALVARGVRAEALIAVGRGEDEPVTTNDTPEGRARNERIAFRWLDGDN